MSLVVQKINRVVLKTYFSPPRIYLLFEIRILGKRRKVKLKSHLRKPKMKTKKTG